MRSVRWLLLVTVLLLLIGASVWWGWLANPVPAEALYPAGSGIPDNEALGGFGKSSNFPKDLAGQDWGEPGKVSLVAFPNEFVTYADRRGPAVRLINRTDVVVAFAACNSWLYLAMEARDREGSWRPIEIMPDSDCGNSFHRVFLDKNQYWEFPALRYSGTFKTRLRFRLEQGTFRRSELDLGEHGDKRELVHADRGGDVIYSNEFEGWINESLIWFASRNE